jgi:uncharacterized protein YxeA
MVVTASLTGLFKTILILIGVLVALRFLGRVMIAKRNLDEERELLKRERSFQKERNEKLKNFGKVSVSKKQPIANVEDVDFEEVNQ